MDARAKQTALEANNYQFGIDTNQQRTFDRLLSRVLDENPDLQIHEAAIIAGDEVRALLPTAREAAQQIAGLRGGTAYCYLAFHGLGGVATYLKVGMSSHPERRFCSASTDNPLDRLWTFLARFPVRAKAFAAEKSLIRHLSQHKRKGEWVSVGQTDRASAAALTRQLSEVVGVAFLPLEAARGH